LNDSAAFQSLWLLSLAEPVAWNGIAAGTDAFSFGGGDKAKLMEKLAEAKAVGAGTETIAYSRAKVVRHATCGRGGASAPLPPGDLRATRRLQRLRRVDVEERALAFDGHFRHGFGVPGDQVPRADIAVERHQLLEEAP